MIFEQITITYIKHFQSLKALYPDNSQFAKKYILKQDQEGVWWKKLMYQHFSERDKKEMVFQNKEEALNINEEHKYSILWTLNDTKYRNMKTYEFRLEYPELEGFNHWNQTSNPLQNEDVENLNLISCTWSHRFGGLMLTKINNIARSLMKCDETDNWWYAVGQYDIYDHPDNIAGPFVSSESAAPQYTNVHYINLWIKATPDEIALIPTHSFTRMKGNRMTKIVLATFWLCFLI